MFEMFERGNEMLKVRTHELRGLPDQERERRLDELVERARAPRNWQASVLTDKIRELEVRYEIDSTDMLKRLARGEMTDTADVSRWLILLRARDGK